MEKRHIGDYHIWGEKNENCNQWRLEVEKGVSVIQCVYNERNEPITDEAQKLLAAAHYRKADMCDAVYIVDIDGYIGTAVADEISYAKENGYISHIP